MAPPVRQSPEAQREVRNRPGDLHRGKGAAAFLMPCPALPCSEDTLSMTTSDTFRCGLCWQVRPKRRFACNTQTFLPLPLCRDCRALARSGLPSDVAPMALGYGADAVTARIRVFRKLLTASPDPQFSPERGRSEILQRAVGRLTSELYLHRCDADDARERGDWSALARTIDAATHTLRLRQQAEAMLLDEKKRPNSDEAKS